MTDIVKYQNFKYHFIVDGLLFSSAILNDTSTIFTTRGLNDAK